MTGETTNDQLQGYGKLSVVKQFNVLLSLLKKTNSKLSIEDEKLIIALKIQLGTIADSEDDDNLKLGNAIKTFKAFITKQELHNSNSEILNRFKDLGLYRILYHKTTLIGQDDNSGLLGLMKAGFVGVGLSALGVALFVLSSFVTFPAWAAVITTGIFAASVTYIGAIIYGVTNDLFATRFNLPYFLLGHQPQQHSLLRTNDPAAVGIAWGVAATFPLASIAAIGFGVVAGITAAFVPVATFLFPVMILAMPLIAYGAERYAHQKANEYVKEGLHEGRFHINDFKTFSFDLLNLNSYEQDGLRKMVATPEEKASWFANSDRNVFGFFRVPFIGVGALIATVALSLFSGSLPAVLFGTTAAVIAPAAVVGLGILALTVGGIYTYANRNTQIDNRFKLAFNSEDLVLEDELYLDEDMHLVVELDKAKKPIQQRDLGEELSHYPNPLGLYQKPVIELEDTPAPKDTQNKYC